MIAAMTFEASPRAARVLGALRFGLLSVACLGLAHDAVFAAEHGFGAGFAAAMSAGGHDGYWTIFSVVVVFAVTVLGLTTVVRLGRLGAAGRRPGRRAGPQPLGGRRQPARPYRQDLRGLWFPLLALTATAFTVQENLEHLLGHGHLIGLSALVGPEYPLALPTIALVTLAAAALGALVRWRIAALEARVTSRPHLARPRTDAVVRPAVRWLDVAAIVAHARFLTRPDAERAPPRIA
ncbi:MAG: hypothetical protein QOF11_1083 [Chloroflexota bacterium]|jgi:hypothetical protein|nr:hypothetical protein [Chloroflexota bacterium]